MERPAFSMAGFCFDRCDQIRLAFWNIRRSRLFTLNALDMSALEGKSLGRDNFLLR